MTPEEMEYRIKRLENAMIDMALHRSWQGGHLGICVNSSLHPNIRTPHWMPIPYIDFTRDIISLPGEYNKDNYPEDFQDD